MKASAAVAFAIVQLSISVAFVMPPSVIYGPKKNVRLPYLDGLDAPGLPSEQVRCINYSSTELHLIRGLIRKLRRKKDKGRNEDVSASTDTTMPQSITDYTTVIPEKGSGETDEEFLPKDSVPHRPSPTMFARKKKPTEQVDICIIGAGVSGLTAALTACENSKNKPKVVVLEASPTIGGRVQSDKTQDGFILDRGFAVFIEQYPVAQQVLDYEALQLKPFLPGALVKLPNRTRLARVADPLRVPSDLFTALTAPVGGLLDKIKVLPLIVHVRTSSIGELFSEPEITTEAALTNRWCFSEAMQQSFFQPFLEGIYLAPLAEQSSRMFNFVFKMFSEGAATLPTGGMGAVSQQLADRASAAGVDVRTNQAVKFMDVYRDEDDDEDGEKQEKNKRDASPSYLVETMDGKTRLQAKSILVATDGVVAQQLIAELEGFASLEDLPVQPQRSVGNLYYSFKGEAPVKDPILILNGDVSQRNTASHPVNNICFPSVVNPSYAPEGYSLCSVTVLSQAMDAYEGDDEGLDKTVRQQLAEWFRNEKVAILDESQWKLQGIYRIPKAQPGQLKGPFPANQNGGRPANTFRGKALPPNIFVCGDHMATATLNGALESGILAGQEAAKVVTATASNKIKA